MPAVDRQRGGAELDIGPARASPVMLAYLLLLTQSLYADRCPAGTIVGQPRHGPALLANANACSRPIAAISLRRLGDCHDNLSAAAQFYQQAAGALWIRAGQAGAQRIQQSRSSRPGEWCITPRCKTVAFALVGLALACGFRAVGAGWACHRSIIVTVTITRKGVDEMHPAGAATGQPGSPPAGRLAAWPGGGPGRENRSRWVLGTACQRDPVGFALGSCHQCLQLPPDLSPA